ncbi:hypothetical protein DVH05_014898 [Phytophthora capsici]|nr:hypothetical protein DVH05_014898 [Phytophthora capsici]
MEQPVPQFGTKVAVDERAEGSQPGRPHRRRAGARVEQAAIDAVNTGRRFKEFFSDVGLLPVSADYSEDLDNELWSMEKQRDETVVKFSKRLKENVRMFAELPVNAEEVLEVQQCRYLKRGMLRAWQEKLATAGIVHDRLSELVLNFSRIEKAEQQLATHEKKQEKHSNGRNKDQRGDKTNSKSQHKDTKENSDRSERKSKSEKWCSFHKTSSHSTQTKQTSSKRTPRYPRIHRDFESDADPDASEEEFKFVGLVTKKERITSAPTRIPVKIKRSGHTFDALLDSVASKSIVNGATLAANVNLGRKYLSASPTVFDTMNGLLLAAVLQWCSSSSLR